MFYILFFCNKFAFMQQSIMTNKNSICKFLTFCFANETIPYSILKSILIDTTDPQMIGASFTSIEDEAKYNDK